MSEWQILDGLDGVTHKVKELASQPGKFVDQFGNLYQFDYAKKCLVLVAAAISDAAENVSELAVDAIEAAGDLADSATHAAAEVITTASGAVVEVTEWVGEKLDGEEDSTVDEEPALPPEEPEAA